MSCPILYSDYTNSFYASSSHTETLSVFDPSTGNLVDLTGVTASFYATQNWSGSYCMVKDNVHLGGISTPTSSLGTIQINFSPSDTAAYQYTTTLLFDVFVSQGTQSLHAGKGTLIINQGANTNQQTGNYPDYDTGWF